MDLMEIQDENGREGKPVTGQVSREPTDEKRDTVPGFLPSDRDMIKQRASCPRKGHRG